jgi:hypothetical protein
MTGSLPLNLILSLVFGLGQVIVGAWLAYPLLGERRRQWRVALLAFVGLWFAVSGVIELFVSGMEMSQRLVGAPAAAGFALWRGRADTVLFVASALLALGAVVYLLALRWRFANHADDSGGAPDATREEEQG